MTRHRLHLASLLVAPAAILALAITLVSPSLAAEGVRELSTDRPDVTESPFSVPRGWVQVEMDGVIWSRHELGDLETRTLGVAATNLKLGLTDRADLQVVYEPWVRTRIEVGGAPVSETTKNGELALRLKWNLIGNDGGKVGLGLLPWIAWQPDAGGANVDAVALAVPFGLALGERLGLGAMIEGSSAADEWALLGTATLAADLGGSLGLFGEIAAERAFPESGDDEWRSTLNAGATLGLGDDLQLDGGVRLGLTDSVEDVTAFLGFAARRPLRAGR